MTPPGAKLEAILSREETDAMDRGSLLAGKYRVDRILGKGGVGIVVAATHVDLDQKVAIKFLRSEALTNPDAVERFSREARAAAMIRSEHVARVHDIGKLDSGAPYMVMEFLEGQDLDQLLNDGPLPVKDVVNFMMQACEGLAEAHGAGIIHRDLKPANLFLTRKKDGTPILKVLDFGISKLTGKQSSGSGRRRAPTTTEIMGSPGYMSPEQMRSTRTVDHRADIWALGTVMYELLTAQPAFVADTIEQLFFLITECPPDPVAQARPEIPEGLAAVVMKCLEKKPEDRYADVADLAKALSAFASTKMDSMAPKLRRVLESRPDLDRFRVPTDPRAPTVIAQAVSAVTSEPVSVRVKPRGLDPREVEATTDRELQAFRAAQHARKRKNLLFAGGGGFVGLGCVLAYVLTHHAGAAPTKTPDVRPTEVSSPMPPPPPATMLTPSAPLTSLPVSPSHPAVAQPGAPLHTRTPPSPSHGSTPPPAPSLPASSTGLPDFGDRK